MVETSGSGDSHSGIDSLLYQVASWRPARVPIEEKGKGWAVVGPVSAEWASEAVMPVFFEEAVAGSMSEALCFLCRLKVVFYQWRGLT